MEMNDGAVYEGDFVNNQYHGQGQYTWPDGSYYQGQWNENKYVKHRKIVIQRGHYSISGNPFSRCPWSAAMTTAT
jgi:hypothetical protein